MQYVTHALRHAARLIEQGADWLDVGGESTRPGSMPVDVQEELRRVIPVVEALVEMKQPVSVDTSKPEVMRAAIRAGATMINDVNALRAPGALEAVAAGGVTACLMHMQGQPRNMQLNPQYDDVVSQVRDFLLQRLHAAQAAGISSEQLIMIRGSVLAKRRFRTSSCCASLIVSANWGCRYWSACHVNPCWVRSRVRM